MKNRFCNRNDLMSWTRWLIILLGILAMGSVKAGEEITITHEDLKLNANLEMADGKDFSDGIVLIVHGTMAHYGMEIIAAAQEVLLENELSSLAINLSLNIDNRHGFFDCQAPHYHTQEDSLIEIGAWIDWLRQQGVTEVTLMGHSRGANQVMVYSIENPAPEVTHVLLLAPGAAGTERGIEQYEARYDIKVADVVAKAEQQISRGNGDQLATYDFLSCPQANVTPKSFLSYWGENRKFNDVETIVNNASIPTLVVMCGQDELQPNALPILESALGNDIVQLEVVEESGHFFRDLNMYDAIDLAVEFIANEG